MPHAAAHSGVQTLRSFAVQATPKRAESCLTPWTVMLPSALAEQSQPGSWLAERPREPRKRTVKLTM